MAMSASGITVREAWSAARTVRRAEYGRRAYDSVRPRGMSWLVRSRIPLSAVLWVAAREGRLVWQDTGGFALLEPPRTDKSLRPETGNAALPVLTFADAYYDVLATWAPCVPVMLLAVGLVLPPWRTPQTWFAAVLLMVATVCWIALMMGLMLVVQAASLIRAVATRRDENRTKTDNTPFLHWTLRLCHQERPARSTALMDQVRERLYRLVTGEAEHAARQRGTRIKPLGMAETLACLMAGATTPAAREALLAAGAERPETGAGVTFIASFDGEPVPAHRRLDSGTFLFIYLAALPVYVLSVATMVPGWERAVCHAHGCAGRASGFWSAVEWELWQLAGALVLRALGWREPGPAAHAWQAVPIAWLLTGLTLMLPVVAQTANWRNRQWRRHRSDGHKKRMVMVEQTKVVVMVAADVEYRAVHEEATRANGAEPRQWPVGSITVLEYKDISAARLLLVHCGQGALGPGDSTLTAHSVVQDLSPDYLILTGIGFGLMPDEQNVGDVMVSRQLRLMDHKEVVDSPTPGERPIEFPRGDRPAASVTLLDRARVAALLGWDGPRVQVGPMLTLNTRISSADLRERLRAADPDAIGGDMEGSGVYAASARGKVDWIVIKGISDFGGHGGTDREVAARTAARFVVHLIQAGGLNRPPAR
jgi:nucleoside phosphorylase